MNRKTLWTLTLMSFSCLTLVAASSLPPYQNLTKKRESLFKGRVLTSPAPQISTIASFCPADNGFWPLTYTDPNITDVQIKDGVFRFKLNSSSVTLGWGNYDKVGRKKIKNISWKQGAYVVMKIRQSQPAGKPWLMDFRYHADSRDTGLLHSYAFSRWGNKFKGTTSNTEWKSVESSFIQQLGEADGFGLIITGEKGSIVEIASIKVVKKDYQLWARKTFMLPDEPVFSALADIAVGEDVWVNGKQVYNRAVSMYSGWYKFTSINIKPFLRKGKNVIAIYDPMDNPRCPIAWLQTTIVTNSGKKLFFASDESWKTSESFHSGWAGVNYDDSSWKPTGSHDPMQYMKPDNMRPVLRDSYVPVNDGLISLSNPDGVKFFYKADKPTIFTVKLPPDMDKPKVSYSIYNEDTGKIVKKGDADFTGKTAQALELKIDAGKLERGVYSLVVNCAAEKEEYSRVEPFIVAGRIPMPEVTDTAWNSGCKLTLVDQIDCTNPNDTHPFQDAGIIKPEYASRVVERNGLKYRETTLKKDIRSRASWFSYRIKFKNIDKPHWVVVEYPDDAPRCMEWEIKPFFMSHPKNEKFICSWTASGVVTGGKYPNTGKIRQARLLLWPQRKDGIISFVKSCGARGNLAVSGIKVYEIDELPALKTTDRGRLFGLVTERANGLELTYGPSNVWIQLHGNRGGRIEGFPEKIPDKYLYNPFLRWFKTAENYARYCRFTGQNAYCQGAFQYERLLGLPYTTGAEGCSLVQDLRDVVINVLDANGIKTFATFEYCKNYNYHSEGAIAPHQAFQGKDSMFQINISGSGARAGNPSVTGKSENPMASPLARKAYMEELKLVVDRLAIYPGFKGVVALVAPSWIGIAYPDDQSSFDDQTVRLFEKETGIRIPVADSGMERFKKRRDWIMSHVRPRWMKWRSQKIAEIHGEASHAVQAVRPDLEYLVMLETWSKRNHPRSLKNAYEKKTHSALDVLNNQGYNPEAYKNIKNFYFGRILWGIHTPFNNFFYSMYDSARWEYSRDPQVVKSFNKNGGKGRAAFVRTGFTEFLLTSLYTTKEKAWPVAHRLAYLYPSGDNMMSRFTEMLVDSDIDIFLYGFCDFHTCTGGEGRFRSFVGEFASLPNSRFTTLKGNGLDKNISIKESGENDKYFIYLANTGWWECQVKLKVSGRKAGSITYTRTGLPVNIADDNTIVISLKPNAILGLTGHKSNLKPVGAKVKISDDVAAALWRKLAELKKACGASKIKKLGKLEQKMKNGDFIRAWQIMSSWEMHQQLIKQE